MYKTIILLLNCGIFRPTVEQLAARKIHHMQIDNIQTISDPQRINTMPLHY